MNRSMWAIGFALLVGAHLTPADLSVPPGWFAKEALRFESGRFAVAMYRQADVTGSETVRRGSVVLLDRNGAKTGERVFPGWCHLKPLAGDRFAVSSADGKVTVLDQRGKILFAVPYPEDFGSPTSKPVKRVSCYGYEAISSLSGNEVSFFLRDDLEDFLPILSEIRVHDLAGGKEIARFAPLEPSLTGGTMDFVWVGKSDRHIVAEGRRVYLRQGLPPAESEIWKSREFPFPVFRLIPMGDAWVGVRFRDEKVPGGLAVLDLKDGRVAFLAPGPVKKGSLLGDRFDQLFSRSPMYARVRENGDLLLSGGAPGQGPALIVPPQVAGKAGNWNPEKALEANFFDPAKIWRRASGGGAPKPDGFRADFSDPGKVRLVPFRLERSVWE